jgi:hypothetical protein
MMRVYGGMLLLVALVASCHHQSDPGAGDGSVDGDADSDSDTDIDADADGDTDSDADTDVDPDGGPSDPLCAMELGGSCVGLVAGCAACAEGSSVADQLADCESDEWCCVPYSPPENDCETGGGVCVEASDDTSTCPTGWTPVYTSCGSGGLMCCMPGDGCV